MSVLVDTLHRTNKSILVACEELGIELTHQVVDSLDSLYQCSHCGVWYLKDELISDRDGSDVCKFCHTWYQYG